jgi:hypothetical protein
MILKKSTWAVIYSKFFTDEANAIFEKFAFASEKLGIKVEEPIWIEVKAKATEADYIE